MRADSETGQPDLHAINRGVSPESTESLLLRCRADDAAAREALFTRFRPVLTRWAHGRLPAPARALSDTEDLVQASLIRALGQIDRFEPRGAGSFLAYLRMILLNQVREEIRRQQARPATVAIEGFDAAEPEALSPVERLAGAERLRDYEAALATLPKPVQELVVMRIEFGMSYAEIGFETGIKPDTVRVKLARALMRMAKALRPDHDQP
jgi:RNA polymerase sigma factor (sigma-70 family)